MKYKNFGMELTMTEVLPHYEYEKMQVTIEPFTNETRIDIEVMDGWEDRKNSRVSMSLDDFDRIALVVTKYRAAKQVAESVGAE